MKEKDNNQVIKTDYESPKMSSLDARKTFYGGEAGPDDCNPGSSAIESCVDGNNAQGVDGSGCATGNSAAQWCGTGNDGGA